MTCMHVAVAVPISSPKAHSRAGASAASGVMYWSHGIGNGQPDLAILSMLMNMNNDPIEVYQLRCEGSLGYRLSGTLPKGEFDYQIGQYIDMGVGKFRIQGIEHHQGNAVSTALSCLKMRCFSPCFYPAETIFFHAATAASYSFQP